MPDKRAHRGAHPQDAGLFSPPNRPILRHAVADLSWLLSRRYAEKSALKIVGDHYQLASRQRMAVMRGACRDHSLELRSQRRLPPDALRGQNLLIDGYNVLTSVEAALAGGFLFIGRDGCIRDVASMHGSYRKVQETTVAIDLIGQAMQRLALDACQWFLDAPVSNSGRLKTIILQIAESNSWHWSVEIVPSPDHTLMASTQTVATADSVILDRCHKWFNLARHVIEAAVPDALLIDLTDGGGDVETV